MACRWTGQFQAPFTGEMVFALASTGPAVLYVDGIEVVRSWKYGFRRWSDTWRTPQGRVYLLQGQWYRFEVQSYEKKRHGSDRLFLGYKTPGA